MALALTYLFRRKLKKNWMLLHRILTIALLACVLFHIVDVGIQLPGRITEWAIQHNNSAQNNEDMVTDSSTPKDATSRDSNFLEASEAVTFSGATLADGTYEGSANGFNGTITVSVTVSGGIVTDITVENENDTPDFFERAESIFNTILDQQSLEVETISGATFSSVGLIDAVSNALQDAVVTGDLKVNEVDLSTVNRQNRH